MTDLFTRLARAAQGAAPIVRPRLRSRFEDGGEEHGLHREAELEQPPIEAGPGDHTPATAPDDSASAPSVRPWHAAPDGPEAALPSARDLGTPPAPPARAAGRPPDEPHRAPPPERRDAATPAAAPRPQQPAPGRPEPDRPATEHHHHHHHHREVFVEQRQPESAAPPVVPAPAPPTPPSTSRPATPAEPRRPPAAERRTHTPAPTLHRRRQPAAEAPPPVIITIGRIDVRAVREPTAQPAPPPPPPARRAPDLERYLSGLEGEGR